MTIRDPSSQPKGGWWIHKKTSKRYEIVTFALIESTLEPSVVYRSDKGQVWIRPAHEFFDGRFQQENIDQVAEITVRKETPDAE